MSVRIGKPVRSFTRASTRSPSSRPGPRNDVIDVRFALSNDALNTIGTPTLMAMALSARAVSTACDSLSITQGPRIKASGCPVPNETAPAATGVTVCIWMSAPVLGVALCHAHRRFIRGAMLRTARGFHETRKQRMGLERTGLEFRMELHRQVPRMAGQFRDLHKLAVW